MMLKSMVIRNLRLYFRDRASVFFSLLGVIIIILMYVLFLGDLVVDMAEGFSNDAARYFTDSWVMSGVITSATMTTCLAGFGTMVEDKAKKISMDFESSPIKRSSLVLSYVISAMIIGFTMSVVTLLLGEIYIVLYGGSFLSFKALLEVLGIIILSVASSSAVVFFLVTTIKSPSAFGTLSTLIGTLVGFLTGVYVPIGNLPVFIQGVIKVIPLSHAAAALRQIMMREAIPLEYIPADTRVFMGIQFESGDGLLPFWVHLLILFCTFVVFYLLSVLIISKRKTKA